MSAATSTSTTTAATPRSTSASSSARTPSTGPTDVRQPRGLFDAGGSVLYLGGDGIYENGEYEPAHRMVFRDGVDGGPRVAALFRVVTPAMPAFPPRRGHRALRRAGVGLRVDLANHPLFANVTVVDVTRETSGRWSMAIFRRDRAEHGLRQRQGERLGSRHPAGVGAISIPPTAQQKTASSFRRLFPPASSYWPVANPTPKGPVRRWSFTNTTVAASSSPPGR